MSEFMIWLYRQYIKPQLDAAPPGDYGMHVAFMENELGPHALESYEKVLELTAIRAFSLGLLTGESLARR